MLGFPSAAVLFLARFPCEQAFRRQVEAELIRRLKAGPTEVASFLHNTPMRSRTLGASLNLVLPGGVAIDGFVR